MAQKRSKPTDAGLSWWDWPFIIVILIVLIPMFLDLFNMVVRAICD